MQLDLFDSLDLSNANETVLVANTPSYLLERLRKDSSVAHIAQTTSTDELLKELRNLADTPPAKVHDIVRRYIYIAALAMKDPLELWPEFSKIDLHNTEWGDQLRSMIESQTIATNRVVIGTPLEAPTKPPSVSARNTLSTKVIQERPDHGRIIL